MKVLLIHNDYRNPSGEEHSVDAYAKILISNGHEIVWFRKSSSNIEKSLLKKISAFLTGIYNPITALKLNQLIKTTKPDIVQIQNIYPLISPSILKIIKLNNIPLVMRCPNYRLFCPSGMHLDSKGRICENCLGKGKELNAILKNCENDIFKSTGYALRNFSSRRFCKIFEMVDLFIVQTEFQKNKFIANGIDEIKIKVIPGFTEDIEPREYILGKYVSFVGRISNEKGIKEFLNAAKELPYIPFKVIGKLDATNLHFKKNSPPNVTWTGFLSNTELELAYTSSRIIVCPGLWYEGFPNVVIDAMIREKAVISTNLGAMSSIIDDKLNGSLIELNDSDYLVKEISALYANPELCKRYGEHGHKKARTEFSKDIVYTKLINVYSDLLNQTENGN